MLALNDISLAFGGLRVLQSVTLEAEAGSIVGLIGPNGSGKSTLLNVASGIHQPQAGSYRINGQRVETFSPEAISALGVGRTFQVPRLARRLTVFQNMLVGGRGQPGERLAALFLRPLAVAQAERALQQRAWAIVERLGLQDKVNDLAGRLSGGQQKLLSMGLLLMSDPAVLLIDEPAAGVNAVLIEQQMRFLRALKDEGRTILLVEHNMDVIGGLCDRVYVLDGGVVLAQGTPEAIRRDKAVLESYLGGTGGGQ